MFCPNCGNRINENARFCASCGAAVSNSPPAMPATGRAPGPAAGRGNAIGKTLQKKGLIDYLLIPFGIILILMGISFSLLTFAGRDINARVIASEQILILHNDPSSWDSRRYKLEYQFPVDGKEYTGSVTRIFENDSHIRTTIPVRYLSFWPHINNEDGVQMIVGGPLMLGAGILSMIAGRKRTAR